ncbi:MAG: putative helix-destabilizing protein [Prokaryotic dsDNA virus sp.]|nr:MAG: putative helix-destabilizing protein [Prokaryotic dsDNA virus sp.]QDP56780.1 MAG: putative helix-destabilizing protein [Prokaryotic dsDNA virus sp.]QDP63771.1 MAG: putative helix-destabilizing protein [Prokaryotic dsDNA virus sp.]QDP63885.1 MAG: putative helix-destabilizing protein [Prokaryotic dsDNA virus sp.]|tara:strand:- start:28222 stop:28728 length:507 start_codon:yes stop_codon:yes gene_type:complete
MSKIKLSNVRLSFPNIFKRATFQGVEGKFEATFLLNKKTQADQIEKLQSAIDEAIKEAKVKVPKDKYCLKDGDDFEYDGYEGHMAFKASTNKRPTLIDRDKSPLVEDDGKPYAGCYVNAIVDIWIQSNDFGKRANSNLFGIQFYADGDAFGSGDIDVTDEFDEFEDDF